MTGFIDIVIRTDETKTGKLLRVIAEQMAEAQVIGYRSTPGTEATGVIIHKLPSPKSLIEEAVTRRLQRDKDLTTQQKAVLEAIEAGHVTTEAIKKATGMLWRGSVPKTLNNLKKKKLVTLHNGEWSRV